VCGYDDINIGMRFTPQQKSATKSVNDWGTGISKNKERNFIVSNLKTRISALVI
jgi:hypothetical protein